MKQNGRRSSRQNARGWVPKVVANDVECFGWSGTRQDAADLRKG